MVLTEEGYSKKCRLRADKAERQWNDKKKKRGGGGGEGDGRKAKLDRKEEPEACHQGFFSRYSGFLPSFKSECFYSIKYK